MATDRLINSTQGDSIINELDNIATKIQGINHDINLPSNQIVAMTGYSEPSGTSAITPSNTLNEAIGKLERKADTNTNNISSLYNSGQKNHLSINTTTYTASGNNRALKIPVDNISGTIHIYFGEITSTDTDDTTCGVLLVDSNDNTIQTIQFGRGVNKDVSVYVGSTAVASISIYPATNWTNSADDTVSITNGMICSQEAWGATGGTYEPYAMSNAAITAWIIAHS